jgi:phosphoribosylanthranilate isomerase
MKVKICGITNLEDALAAVEAGADLLGFNFYPPSPRYISPGSCAAILEGLERRRLQVVSVGVFVNASPAQVAAILSECGLAQAQLSGDEPPADLELLGERAFKSLRPENPETLAAWVSRYPRRSLAPAWLVDAYRPGQYGGTGQVADWSLARSLAEQAPVLLAGGLRPENVAEAIAQVQPWGVDVASGVEFTPGRKDRQKMAAFIAAARQVTQENQP